jgi:hypothetical protein
MDILTAPVSVKPDPLVMPRHAAPNARHGRKPAILPNAGLSIELVDPDKIHLAVAVDLVYCPVVSWEPRSGKEKTNLRQPI